MASSQTDTSQEKGRSPRFMRTWLIILVSLFLAAVFGYYQYRVNQENFINTNYFRILSESAAQSNENILQLKELHKFNESESIIRAIFPSYALAASKSDTHRHSNTTRNPENNSYSYTFDGQVFLIKQAGREYASVMAEDILTHPTKGFMLYLFVDDQNRVITSTGDKSVISVVDVSHISHAIAENQNQNWMDFSSSGKASMNKDNQSLPGFSHYIDLKLTSTPFRLFIYPLRLDSGVTLLKTTEDSKHLYLIGVLPQSLLKAQDNKRWNLSLLSIVLILLLFIWMMLRMFMLSNNQPVGDLFYRATMFCSYMLFVMVISIVIAYGEREVEEQYKEEQASLFIENINQRFLSELVLIFNEMELYRDYFQQLLTKKQQLSLEPNPQNQHKLNAALFSFPIDPNVPNQIKAFSTNKGSVKVDGQALPSIANVYYEKPERLSQINLFTDGAQIDKPEQDAAITEPANFSMWFNPNQKTNGQGHILNALLLNNSGNQVLPMLYSIESNKMPVTYHLSHRTYFKKVRDQQGWNATFKQNNVSANTNTASLRAENFYLQRLRNVGSGTRGTTLAMPLYAQGAGTESMPPEQQHYILAADIALASLTMTEVQHKDELLDMTFMVVDRNNGDVLFHLDDDRTMIENLFEIGQGTEDISHRISAGLDGPAGKPLPWVNGFYHGIAGKFTFKATPISQWALVVFVPDESINTYMTNLFLLNTISMAAILVIMAFLIILMRKFEVTYTLKNLLGIPLVIERRKILVFSSVFIAVVYLGFWLGVAIDRQQASEGPTSSLKLASYWLPWLFASLCLLWGLIEYRRFYQLSRQAQRNPIELTQGIQILGLLYLGLTSVLHYYLSNVGMASSSSLRWYYTQNVYPARLNKELQEIKKVALSRYPNSISRHLIDPLSLVPISDKWRKELTASAGNKAFILPDDIESISNLINTSDAKSWVSRYLLTSKDPVTDFPRPLTNKWYPLQMSLTFMLICLIWLKFNRRILAFRLYGSPHFLRHIYQIAKQSARPLTFKPAKNLIIDTVEAPEAGYSLAMLLQMWITQPDKLPNQFEHLFACCPLFTEIARLKTQNEGDILPNMKVRLCTDDDLLHLQIWDIEISLEHPTHRATFLRLVNHCKSLHIAGKLHKVTIYGGFHSLQRLCLKDAMLSNEWLNRHQLERNEYFAWAECLMDFSVTIPDFLKAHLDNTFIHNEIKAFPLLKFLEDELPQKDQAPATPFNLLRWISLRDWQKTHSEWASINFILLKAEAIYRFKWESCSAAEKLALYYLVQNKRINPANMQMLEHLALNGLIVVKRGRLHIVNQSFAYFVKHAEDKETLTQLVDKGDVGNWRDYRMPITLMILLIIGGIALTSGNSLYMIVASVMGVLGTIGSLTNSASLIRNNLQK